MNLSLKFEKICCYSSFSSNNPLLCEFGILNWTTLSFRDNIVDIHEILFLNVKANKQFEQLFI
jgi:hypothetical protein